jgi:outer membrane receptor protein involved in Fe transport
MSKPIKYTLVSVAALVGAAGLAYAQDATVEDAPVEDEIVVTAVASQTTTLQSSVSVTTLNAEAIEDLSARTTAEIFRSVPGIRSESSGGDGNANIAVRGIPIATGGAKYLQIQEDGLPILEFGDIAFGNADIFTRADYTIARVQAVRGGSASTFASNSPGGVINFITDTGRKDGATIGFTQGIDFDSSRADFRAGGEFAPGWFGSFGGFYRTGEGARDAGYTGEQGGQFRATVLRDLDNGFVRLSLKYLNDRAIAYLPSPIRVTGSDSDPSFGALPGYDASNQTIHSKYFKTVLALDGQNQVREFDVTDGMNPEVLALSGEFNFDLAGGWNIANKFRVANNEGNFISPFTAGVDTVGNTAVSIGGVGATARYANGPNAGALVPANANGNGLLQQVVLFNTVINDFGNFANDFSLSRSFDVGGGALDARIGFYRARQKINMDWLWNSYILEVKGDNAALVNIFNAGGIAQTQNGLLGYAATPFGGGTCCRRNYDATYDISAPYASISWEAGPLVVDGSVRFDIGKVKGSYTGSSPLVTQDINGDGIIQAPETRVTRLDPTTRRPVNYEYDYVSYSIGANYKFTDDLAAFGRISRGSRANADRLLFQPAILASGDVRSDEDAVDQVDQYEAGVRYRNGPVSVFATAFFAKTEDTNFEATSQLASNREYEAKGIELEGFLSFGNFDVNGGVTWTDAEITADAGNPATVGNTPRRQADWVYQATGTYTWGPLRIGTNLVGTTDSFAQFNNQLVLPGYVIVNPFASYDITDRLSVAVNVNNAFDEFAVTEAEEGSLPGNGVVRARTLNGRTATIGLKYDF